MGTTGGDQSNNDITANHVPRPNTLRSREPRRGNLAQDHKGATPVGVPNSKSKKLAQRGRLKIED